MTRLDYFLLYARDDESVTGVALPDISWMGDEDKVFALSRYMATCGRYGDEDTNLDAQKRNLAMRTFIDHDLPEIRSFGLSWLRRFYHEHGHAPWYLEWMNILENSSDNDLAKIYMSGDEDSTRLRISRPTGLLPFEVALKVKRDGVPV